MSNIADRDKNRIYILRIQVTLLLGAASAFTPAQSAPKIHMIDGGKNRQFSLGMSEKALFAMLSGVPEKSIYRVKDSPEMGETILVGFDKKSLNGAAVFRLSKNKILNIVGLARIFETGDESLRNAREEIFERYKTEGNPSGWSIIKSEGGQINPALIWFGKDYVLAVDFNIVSTSSINIVEVKLRERFGESNLKSVSSIFDVQQENYKNKDELIAAAKQVVSKVIPNANLKLPLLLAPLPPPRPKIPTLGVRNFSPLLLDNGAMAYFHYDSKDRAEVNKDGLPLSYSLRLRKPGSQPTVLAKSPYMLSFPTWDGKDHKFLFESMDGLYIVNEDGKSGLKIYDGYRAYKTDAVFNPVTGSIAMAGLQSPPDVKPGINTKCDIFTAQLPDIQGLPLENIKSVVADAQDDFLPEWDNDGKILFYVVKNELGYKVRRYFIETGRSEDVAPLRAFPIRMKFVSGDRLIVGYAADKPTVRQQVKYSVVAVNEKSS